MISQDSTPASDLHDPLESHHEIHDPFSSFVPLRERGLSHGCCVALLAAVAWVAVVACAWLVHAARALYYASL
jgi:hypothetical protein